MKINIRLAKKKDRGAIQKFIKDNWRSDHILCNSDSFFDYEMCTASVPNFVIGERTGKIVGLVGFIYNRDNIVESDIFLVMFCVVKLENTAALGIQLLKFVCGLTNRGVHSVGTEQKVLAYYKFIGFKTGYLKHYYWLSSNASARKTFLVGEQKIPFNTQIELFEGHSKIIKISGTELSNVIDNTEITNVVSKSKKFFINRFLLHPIYIYDFYRVPENFDILVVRKAQIKDHQIWRIVDFYGCIEKLPILCGELIKSASSRSISFIDLYVSGIEPEKILKSGLTDISDNVIIPNYLEPLKMENIDISYVTSNMSEPIFFRGDCDQDRPSKLQ